MTITIERPAGATRSGGAVAPATARPAPRLLPPAWPLVGLLALYPLWWALGLGVLIFPIAAVPMVAILLRRWAAGGRIATPPGFAWWLLFLAAVVAGTAALGVDPPGTLAGDSTRLLGVAFRLVEYASLTVLLLYAGNLSSGQLSQRRLVRLLAWLFLVTVAGGVLGLVAGRFAFQSPVELLLPGSIRSNGFVQSLVHPYAAQLSTVLGHATPRPAAPWGYTNTWGNNFCLLVGWLVVAGWPMARSRRTRWLAAACLVVALVPAVLSLNRGLWVGLAVAGVYAATRLLRPAKLMLAAAIAAAGLVAVLGLTPLGSVAADRLAHGESNSVRMYLTERTLSALGDSPLIGFGTTRTTDGGRTSVAVGQSSSCPRCGNFTIGGNGQLWQLLFAHGLLGTLGYLGFFLTVLWRYRRDRSPIGIAASTALVGSLVAMLWYNSLVTPLAFTMLAVALLWRNGQRSDRRPGEAR